jgi:hypothetical protein
MNAKKELQVWINDQPIYNIVNEGNTTRLKTSKSGDWITHNENVCTLVDDGNGVNISIGHSSLNLPYDEALELLVVLLQSNDSKIQFIKPKTIKTICP